MADLGDGEVGGTQKVLRAFDPPLGEMGRRRDAVRGGEQALKVVLADARHGGKRVEIQRIGVVTVGVVPGPPEMHQQATWRPRSRSGHEESV